MIQKKIAFCGTRGIPANYGGFETAVDEISKRFIARGYQCVVICRLSHSQKKSEDDQGRKLVYAVPSGAGADDFGVGGAAHALSVFILFS